MEFIKWYAPNQYNVLIQKGDKIISGHENDFILPSVSKKRFISFNSIKVWKRIPEHLKSTNRFHQFKKDLSKYLLKPT